MSQKMSEKVRRKKNKGKYFEKNQLKKSQNPLNLGKKSQNPEKNCRDFLIPNSKPRLEDYKQLIPKLLCIGI